MGVTGKKRITTNKKQPSKEDCQLNEQAKKEGGRILGAYNTQRGRVYIITDDALANPQVTTVLYADEY